jgi:hypothetical protein
MALNRSCRKGDMKKIFGGYYSRLRYFSCRILNNKPHSELLAGMGYTIEYKGAVLLVYLRKYFT